LMHQMHISTNYVSSMMLRSKNLEIRINVLKIPKQGAMK
jgi:hypothetical protein